MRVRRGLLTPALLVVLVMLVAGLTAPGSSASNLSGNLSAGAAGSAGGTVDGRAIRYVAMGDSFSSAAGVLPLDTAAPPQCQRSTRSYPSLIAAAVGARRVDVTCGGADTGHFRTSQYPDVPPQLDALERGTELVTMTIGLNDSLGFLRIQAACGTAGLATLGRGSPCRDTYGDSFARTIRTTTYPALVRALRGVRARAPRARVAILGIPWVLPRTGGCFPTMPVAQGDVPYVRRIQTVLNDAIRRAARATGAEYVDFARVSEGHDACQPAGRRWIEPAVLGDNPVIVHPNALGEQRMAQRTIDVLGLTAGTSREAPRQGLRVRAGSASALVRSRPFRLSFRDSGREVLSSVPTGGRPTPSLHVSDVLGTVGDTDVVPPRYAPITFTVGRVEMTQAEPFPVVTANPFLTLSAGATYSLTDVLSSRRLPDGGLRLRVATDDPTGRRAVVEVRPDRGDAVRTRVRLVPDTGVAFVGASFTSGRDEAFRGFGGRRNAMDQAGESFFNWIEQTIFDEPPFAGQPQSGWYQQAQFISSRPYGFFLEQSELSRWRMRSDRDDAWQVDSSSRGLKFTVAPGSGPKAIRTLTAITGRTPVPPRWQVAPIFAQTLSGGTTGKSPATYEAEIRASLRKIEELDLPYEAFSFEAWWLLKRVGRLDDIITLIRRHGMRPLVYFRAWAGNDGQGLEDDDAFTTALRQGYGATRVDGSPYVFSDTLAPGRLAVQLDFTNPATIRWWRQRIRAVLDAGADGFMQDFGEQTMWDMRFADGSTGRTAHNRYPIDFHRATRRIIEEWHREHPERTEPMFYVRSGYSGRPGSAAYESANWCGDYESNWTRTTGIAALTTDMLNRAIGGAYGFHCDTGGYMDLLSGPPSRELFLRWSWYAALTPGNRVHGGPVQGQKFPWSWDDRAAQIHRDSLLLHRAAEPYILRLWREAKRTGMPITRPLWLAHPGMRGVGRLDQQYLLGPDVLVAPVVTQGATTRRVVFPPGCWRDPVTGRRFAGSTTATIRAPIDRTPYFFTCGTTPFQPPGARDRA